MEEKYVCEMADKCGISYCTHILPHSHFSKCERGICNGVKKKVRCIRVYNYADEVDELFDDLCEEL